MKELKLIEMQELLADYSFGRLSKNESKIFESNLSNYPDLKNEIIEIRKAFSKVNREELASDLERKTSNLTYKVKQKQYEKNINKNIKKNIVKLVFPIVAFVIFFLVMRNIEFKEKNTDSNLPEVILTDAEANIIFGENEFDYYNPYYNDFYSELNYSDEYEIIGSENTTSITTYNYMNEISESEFNELLDDLDNENFNL